MIKEKWLTPKQRKMVEARMKNNEAVYAPRETRAASRECLGFMDEEGAVIRGLEVQVGQGEVIFLREVHASAALVRIRPHETFHNKVVVEVVPC